MKLLVIVCGFIFSTSLFASSGSHPKANTNKNSFGETLEIPTKGVKSVTEVLNSFSDKKSEAMENIFIKGKIEAVCQSKGCWLTLQGFDAKGADACTLTSQGAASQKDLRVVFKDYGFFVPKALMGEVILKGTVKREKLTPAQVTHFLKDLKCSKETIKAVKAPIYRYRMTADGLVKL